MSTALGILTAIILAASCFIGLKNKTAYDTEIQNRIKLENNRDHVLRPKLIATTKEKNETEAAKNQKLSEAEAKGKEVAAQQKKVDAVKAQITEKEELVKAQKEKIDALKEKLKEHGDIEEIVVEIKRLGADLTQLQADLAASNAKLANLNAERNRTDGVVKSMRADFERIAKNLSDPDLSTSIRSIYPSFGFVMLAHGNNQGVVPGSTLEVVRGGDVVAKLLVKAVEATTAAADIIPGSTADDAVLMTGDRVRASLETIKEEKPAAPAAAAPAAPAAPAAEEAAPAADMEAPAEEAPAATEEKTEEAPAEEEKAEDDPFNE